MPKGIRVDANSMTVPPSYEIFNRAARLSKAVASSASLPNTKEAERPTKEGTGGREGGEDREGVEDSTLAAVLNSSKSLPAMRGGWHPHAGALHLINVDPRFAPLISKLQFPLQSLKPNKELRCPFDALVSTIIYQQLQATSADAIKLRFLNAVGVSEGTVITPEMVKGATFERRAIVEKGKEVYKIFVNNQISGLSGPKASYIQSLAHHFSDEKLLKNVDFATLSDAELFEKLVAVKGLGEWSVHMFMIFQLQRADVMPVGDQAVRTGLAKFTNSGPKRFEGKLGQAEMSQVTAEWSPYRSLGSMFMWHLMDSEPKVKAAKKVKAGKK